MTPIELLSPAKDLACGIAAIDHGADAVYIGAPAFGARSAASNSLDDIATLISYAHQFHARVYVALNTILFDDEIPEAISLAHELYNIGADALIIQDLGLLACDMPPIPLHASTQLNNKTPEKVNFLEQVGFSQVVLARELSLEQIQLIKSQTQVPLEFFVHGAICVCYSGQCYMSAFATNRSGNRGMCSQMCRHKYTISGLTNLLSNEGYFLSPKDLHLGANIRELITAGIQSFKIEGRLKDETYVKNITAYFRDKIDKEITRNPNLIRASHGKETFNFTPNISKTFSRGFTDYFINSSQNKIANIYSSKSQGEFIGTVKKSQGTILEITTDIKLHNGDGLCFYDKNNELRGLRVNSVQGKTISLLQSINLPINTNIWRNYSVEFYKQIEQSKNCRKIGVTIFIAETLNGYAFTITDNYGHSATIERTIEKQIALKPEKIQESIMSQVSKMGESIFVTQNITLNFNELFFISISEINETRRLACNKLLQKRLLSHTIPYKKIEKNLIPYPINEPSDFRLNIANIKSRDFFKQHGILNPQLAYELEKKSGVPLMTTKYCIRYQLDSCPKINKKITKAEQLFISDNAHNFRIEFDCGKCEMNIYEK